jgi:maltose alpha-D-glucosyltransferase/alpha-amylase
MTAEGSGPMRLPASDRPIERSSAAAILAEAAVRALPGYLPVRRWFGHKQRRIATVKLIDAATDEAGDELFSLVLAQVGFEGGHEARYFLPLALGRAEPPEGATIAVIAAAGEAWYVADGPALPSCRRWLAASLAREAAVPGTSGRFAWRATGASSAGDVSDLPSRVISGEQSNTSVVYDDALILKIFRRVDPGINPDVELGRFLTTRTSFRHAPAVYGSLEYLPDEGEACSLAVAQQFVPSRSDGWTFTLGRLAELAATPERADLLEGAAWRDAALLGKRTAEMHLALASGRDEPAIAPEPVGAADVAAWEADLAKAIARTAATLAELAPSLAEPAYDLATAFLAALPRLRSRATGFDLLRGRAKTRVHGDYHLGQVLRTRDDDFVILDFEGEPQRSLAERRAKTSPLKDVAGMLRSFGYARGAAEQAAAGHSGSVPDLIAWERGARRAFLDAYWAEAAAVGAPFLPRSQEDFRQALAPWELDKALYEVAYELNNRPSWLPIPLRGILELLPPP